MYNISILNKELIITGKYKMSDTIFEGLSLSDPKVSKHLKFKIVRYIYKIKLIQSNILNSINRFTHNSQTIINTILLSNIFGNNSSEKPHNY